MNEQTKTPAEEIVWRAEDDQALEVLTPEQLRIARRRHEISSQALADFDRKNAAKSDEQFNRRVAAASDYELNFFKLHGAWPEKK